MWGAGAGVAWRMAWIGPAWGSGYPLLGVDRPGHESCYSRVMKASNPRITGTRKVRLGEESDRADREFWAALTPDERVLETWRLSLELWEFKGWDPGEPGLRRPATRTFRR